MIVAHNLNPDWRPSRFRKPLTQTASKGPVSYSKKGNALTIMAPVVTPTTLTGQYAWVYKLEQAVPQAVIS